MDKALVVGLGMGQQYLQWLTEMGLSVDTVDTDPTKEPTFTDIEQVGNGYLIAVICTPNWTHDPIARSIAPKCSIVFVEKPGLVNADAWHSLVTDFPKTRFAMIKNNQFRGNIGEFASAAAASSRVEVTWNSKNRVPNPGSWFTTKEKAFGGVSRDLIPHMLSYYVALTDYQAGKLIERTTEQRHNLDTIESTDYGQVYKNGTYDVDDFCRICYTNKGVEWILTANWKDNIADNSSITFHTDTGPVRFDLGLCPGDAYQVMMGIAINNINNDVFWSSQYNQDMWIHRQIETI